ncbi:hypothetical protein PHYBLDRAFT_182403 [Phycomyces blakesleeanus NRRL 1555(-)]|uniref:Uncharacterized protein n=1 Tax=Phycomyces blakesleeanus (strain ATCC 8743b / DSM 1359 / FGSC 10004 / NBRC 33097 / NRRL 1555) TaxID=763407 RepID=A0A167LHM2_PHYB8|nr:hypothetical protein PHYBLDRAFT_182403 [Phycomyces blakesleeanus NRRL 1555(-)]OAD70478.1 hypothetical protein PHYBLDRAFT_182403 [Phycomyces blakesleeanus NRRL 1555(-)]|eukprot:XP_018288518.1 hypothetical protein PHYBLDRAFT_182403 [Phycomyces blakesleeanus NRRL 1555(-)]
MTFNVLLEAFFKDCEHKCVEAKLSTFIANNVGALVCSENIVYANEEDMKRRWVNLFTTASANADVTAVIDRNRVLWCEIWKTHAELELAKSKFAAKYLAMIPTHHHHHDCRRCP